MPCKRFLRDVVSRFFLALFPFWVLTHNPKRGFFPLYPFSSLTADVTSHHMFFFDKSHHMFCLLVSRIGLQSFYLHIQTQTHLHIHTYNWNGVWTNYTFNVCETNLYYEYECVNECVSGFEVKIFLWVMSQKVILFLHPF